MQHAKNQALLDKMRRPVIILLRNSVPLAFILYIVHVFMPPQSKVMQMNKCYCTL